MYVFDVLFLLMPCFRISLLDLLDLLESSGPNTTFMYIALCPMQ